MNGTRSLLLILFLFGTGAGAGVATGQSPTGSSSAQVSSPEPGITREQAAKIIQELQMIRMLLQKEAEERAPVNPNSLSKEEQSLGTGPQGKLVTLGDHILGSDNAPVTLVEFLDLQCPFCMEFHRAILPELRQKYIDAGKLRLAVSDFPLESHVYAIRAAVFAKCAGKQGKYWEVHDSLLNSGAVATQETLGRIAREEHLDQTRLDECLQDAKNMEEIQTELGVARRLGVIGAPTFLLGRTQPTGAEGTIIQGAPSLPLFEARIDELLRQDSRR